MSFITKQVRGVQGYMTLPPTSPPTTAPPENLSSGVSAIEALSAAPITITSSASAHTKGSWAAINAATAKEYNGLLIAVSLPSVGNVNMLIDIGVGGIGAEVAAVRDLPLRSNTTADESGCTVYVPLRIAAGSRIVARCQSADGGSDTCRVVVQGFVNSNALYDTIGTYGATPASTHLTAVDPGASAGTKGTWVPLTASTDNNIAQVGLLALLSNLAASTCYWSIDIGVGAEGAEVVVAADIYIGTHVNFDRAYHSFVGMLPLDIPANSRIAVRAACNITDATDRILDVALLGAEW